MQQKGPQSENAGAATAWIAMLEFTLDQLKAIGITHPQAAYALERAQTIFVLRRVCGQHGDGNWPDSMPLMDIIEQHLEPYLQT